MEDDHKWRTIPLIFNDSIAELRDLSALADNLQLSKCRFGDNRYAKAAGEAKWHADALHIEAIATADLSCCQQ